MLPKMYTFRNIYNNVEGPPLLKIPPSPPRARARPSRHNYNVITTDVENYVENMWITCGKPPTFPHPRHVENPRVIHTPLPPARGPGSSCARASRVGVPMPAWAPLGGRWGARSRVRARHARALPIYTENINIYLLLYIIRYHAFLYYLLYEAFMT